MGRFSELAIGVLLNVAVLSVVVLGLVLACSPFEAGSAAQVGPRNRSADGVSVAEAVGVIAASDLRVREGAVQPRLLLTGDVQAAQSVVLSAPSVRVFPLQIRWLADDGAAVSRGDRVVEFDNSQLVSRYSDLESRVQTAGSELVKQKLEAEDQIADAAIELERRRTAHAKAALEAEIPRGLLADQEREQRRLAEVKARLEVEAAEEVLVSTREVAKRNRELARLELADARRELELVRRGLDLLTLRASRDGIVQIAEDWQAGRPLRPGDSIWVGQIAALLPDLSTLRVEAELFDVDEGRLREGQTLQVSLDALGGGDRIEPGETQILEGTVTRVSRLAEVASPRSTRRVFQVVVEVDGFDPERIRPGMSVRLIAEEEPIEGLVVPRESLVWQDSQALLQLASGALEGVELGACDARHCLLEQGPEPGTRLAQATGGATPGASHGD